MEGKPVCYRGSGRSIGTTCETLDKEVYSQQAGTHLSIVTPDPSLALATALSSSEDSCRRRRRRQRRTQGGSGVEIQQRDKNKSFYCKVSRQAGRQAGRQAPGILRSIRRQVSLDTAASMAISSKWAPAECAGYLSGMGAPAEKW